MSLEKLINSALKRGAGVSLRSAKKSDSYKEKVARKLELSKKFGPKTHRGKAMRVGPVLFWDDLCTRGEKGALKRITKLNGDASREALEKDALIEELGDRLIDTAAKMLAPNLKEMAEAYRKAKSVEQQISLLKGLDTLIDMASKKRNEEREKQEGDTPDIPDGYWWVDDCFEDHDPSRFLPREFKRLPKYEMPNCLGMSILLAGWARLAGAKTLYCTEVVHRYVEDYRFQLSVCELLLSTLRGVPGKQARELRKVLKRDTKRIRGNQENVRDWHHGIAIELKDGRWFYLDPYNDQAEVFPPEWHIPEVAKRLRKYEDALPGLTVLQTDHGLQKRYLEGYWSKFTEIVSKAEACRYKLVRDPGGNAKMGHLLAMAPELEYMCDLLMDNNPKWPRPYQTPDQRLSWLMFAWEYKGLKPQSKPGKKVASEVERFKHDPKFRRQKLDDLIVQFCREALVYIRSREGKINPAIEFGNTSFTIALAVLSNLSSWTEEKVPGTLLLEHGSGQMLWHQAVSSVQDFAALTEYEKALLVVGGYVVSAMPQQPRVAFKLQALQEFLHPADAEKEE